MELNPQQRLAAENQTDNLLLLAGAGTGKTGTLACRVAQLIETGAAAPGEILCLTFTNRACREMTDRIAAAVGSAADEVVIRTVHSFCAYLLRNTPARFLDIGRDYAVADVPDCIEVIREVVLQTLERPIAQRPAEILQQFIALVKESLFGSFPAKGESRQALLKNATERLFAEKRAAVERICVDEKYQFDMKFFHFLSKYGASIVALYDQKLLENNLLDFTDLLLRADAVLSGAETAPLWNSRYRYIHVDEVQDVSIAEYRLVKKLCHRARVLFCGDFHQTIYEWRGSSPEALLKAFTADFSPVVITFTVNYRSSAQLLMLAQTFLHHAFGLPAPASPAQASPVPASPAPASLVPASLVPASLVPASPVPASLVPTSPVPASPVPTGAASTGIVLREFPSPEQEVNWIYDSIEALHLSDFSRVAILTRNNRVCTQVCDLLKTHRLRGPSSIRFMLSDEFRLFKRAEIKDLFACVSLCANPRDGESLRRVLTRCMPGIGEATVNGVLAQYKQGTGVSLCDFIDPRTHRTGDFFEPLLAALDEGRVIVFDVESTGTDVYSDQIIQMAAVRLAPDGSVAESFEQFLKNDRPVGASEQVHGYSDAFLSGHGRDPAEALAAFLDFAEGCVVVGHNVIYDMTITAQNLRLRGVSRPFDNLYYDTLDIARRCLKNLDNYKLATVCAALGAVQKPSHDAMDDILATAEALVLLTRRFLRPQAQARRDCYHKLLPRFTPAAKKIGGLRAALPPDVPSLLDQLISLFGLMEGKEPEEQAHLLLVRDFAAQYCDQKQPLEKQLSSLLELAALSASELDRVTAAFNKVAVITAHQAKGCEFDYVFLPFLQEGVFPSYQAIKAENDIEERRLFYVSITRAKKKLFLSWAHVNAAQYPQKPSRFLAML